MEAKELKKEVINTLKSVWANEFSPEDCIEMINEVNEALTIPVVSKAFTIITSCGETLKKCNNCGEIRNILDW